MSAMDIGRICLKMKGREAGKRCVIVDVIDRNYVMVTGPFELTGVKRRRINMNHLKPLDEAIEIPRNATDAEIINVIG